MSYHIDPVTMLFDDLSDEEAATLQKDVEAIVLKGTSLWGTEAFRIWCEVMGYDPNNALLVMSTAYPQRALLSLLRRAQS